MSATSAISHRINNGLRRINLKVLRGTDADSLQQTRDRYEQLLRRLDIDESELFQASVNQSSLPAGASEYLRSDNPRLEELKRRYRASHHAVLEHSLWTDNFVSREVDLQFFRGDLAYVWQFRDLNTELHYMVTTQYLETVDDTNLLHRAVEDGLFGAHTIRIGDTIVSRDLLDSINELLFLERTLAISARTDFNVLDIGAGYGRFAHRFAECFPNVGHVYCVDPIAVSTFVSEYYLRFRGVGDVASVVPLDELDSTLERQRIGLAVNIHSFSEIPMGSINAWLDILVAHEVPYVFLVPNQDNGGGAQLRSLEKSRSEGMDRRDILPAFAQHGYELAVREPKYRDELVQRHGVSPTYYYLFERAAT